MPTDPHAVPPVTWCLWHQRAAPRFQGAPRGFAAVHAAACALTRKWSLAYLECVADVYRALADATRRQILDLLVQRDGVTLFEICGRLSAQGTGSSRQAISQHLAVLEECDLVRTSRVGRTKVHRLNTKPLREIVQRWPID